MLRQLIKLVLTPYQAKLLTLQSQDYIISSGESDAEGETSDRDQVRDYIVNIDEEQEFLEQQSDKNGWTKILRRGSILHKLSSKTHAPQK